MSLSFFGSRPQPRGRDIAGSGGDQARRRSAIGYQTVFFAPAVVVLLAVYIYPLVDAVRISFFQWSINRPAFIRFIGIENYLTAATDLEFLRSILNTFTIGFSALAVQLVLGTGMAVLVAGSFRGKALFRSILFVPVVLSPVGIGAIWRILHNTDVGVVPYLISSLFNLQGFTILSNPHLARAAIVAADIWQATPFVFIMVLAALDSASVEQHEAALLDGATLWQTFAFVTLPLIKPVIVVVTLIRMMDVFQLFPKIFIMTGGEPGGATDVVSMYIVRYMLEFHRSGYSGALAVLTAAVVAVVTLGFYRLVGAGSIGRSD